jgi:DNA-binding transcriptional LysR family regulator
MRIDAISARALRCFLTVVKTGSVRAAADRLRTAPSAVSRQVNEIERQLGHRLFERKARGMQLTEPGEAVAEHARRVLEEQDLLSEKLNNLQSIGQSQIRVCCGDGFIADLMENGLRSFSSIYPNFRFIVELGGTDHILASLSDGEADIGLAYSPTVDTRVRSIAIARQPLRAIVPASHSFLQRKEVNLAEALGQPHGLLPLGHGVRQLIGRMAADNCLVLAPLIETSSIDLLRRFVTSGLGITFLPTFAISSELQRQALGAVHLVDTLLNEASAHILVRARRRLPLSVDRLVGHLAQEMVAFKSTPPAN